VRLSGNRVLSNGGADIDATTLGALTNRHRENNKTSTTGLKLGERKRQGEILCHTATGGGRFVSIGLPVARGGGCQGKTPFMRNWDEGQGTAEKRL